MTAVACIVTHNHAWIAADKFATTETGLTLLCAEPKIFRVGDQCLIGFAGDCAPIRAATRAALRLDNPSPDQIVDAIAEEIDDTSSEGELEGLFVRPGSIVYFTNDFVPLELIANHFSIGSGGSYCLGSLHMSEGTEPFERLRAAIDAAAIYLGSCGGGVDLLSVHTSTH